MNYRTQAVLLSLAAAAATAAVFLPGCGKSEQPAVSPAPQTPPLPGTVTDSDAAAIPPAPDPALPAPLPVESAPAAPPRPSSPPAELAFRLPTDNDALFSDNPAAFYMFTDRYVNGQTIQVWEGGSYGFVRTPRTTKFGEVFTKFHEGVDILPVKRDPKGEPQDTVRAIADGTIAYCNPAPGKSNYGNYVVMAHNTGGGVFYSLYAHLRSITAVAGSEIKAGGIIGQMGYTGDGIDRRRAHVHLELCVMLSERFDDYYRTHFQLPNGHGNFNGQNLAGMDVARFLKACHSDASMSPQAFLAAEEPYFKVVVANAHAGEPDIVKRYPGLRRPGGPDVSWEIAFNGAGVPLSVAPSAKAAPIPAVSWVRPWHGYHQWNTRNLLTGSGDTAGLSPEGSRYVQLVAGEY